MSNKITILCLPPNTSHATQPLDVGVFRSLKVSWRKVLEIHYADPFNTVDKDNFPSLVAKVWEQLKGGNCTADFQATGLHPYNPRALDKKIIPPPVDLVPGAGDAMIDETEKYLANAICKIVTLSHPPHHDISQPGPSGYVPPPKKRARVQMSAGEVLTSDEAAARVLAEEKEKQAKLDEKVEKQSCS